MGKSLGNPKERAILIAELDRLPPSERRRAVADVDGDVEDPTGEGANQLALRVGRLLKVQSAQHAATRVGDIVLYEIDGDLLGDERGALVRLEEEAAVVVVDVGADQDGPIEGASFEVKSHDSPSVVVRLLPCERLHTSRCAGAIQGEPSAQMRGHARSVDTRSRAGPSPDPAIDSVGESGVLSLQCGGGDGRAADR